MSKTRDQRDAMAKELSLATEAKDRLFLLRAWCLGKKYDTRRISDLRSHFFTEEDKLAPYARVETKIMDLIGVGITNPTEEEINRALGVSWKSLIKQIDNRISEARYFHTIRKIKDVGIQVLRESLPSTPTHSPRKFRGILPPNLVRRPEVSDIQCPEKPAHIKERTENKTLTAPLQDYIDRYAKAANMETSKHDKNGADIVWLDFAIEVKPEARDIKYAMKVLVDAYRLENLLKKPMQPVIACPEEATEEEKEVAKKHGILLWTFDTKKLAEENEKGDNGSRQREESLAE